MKPKPKARELVRRHHPNSPGLRAYVKELSHGKVLLAFSCGKDSIAAWLALRDAGIEVVPFYMWLVPDLPFVERSICYYERWFKTPIIRVPHPSFSRVMNQLVFQPPERAAVIEGYWWPNIEYQQLEDHVRTLAKVPHETFVGIGTRTADSPIRLANVRQFGSLNPARRSFLPVFDWKIVDVVASIERSGVRLPIDYRLFGRSFDGLDHRFLTKLREHLPDDYKHILEWFPLADLEIMRRCLDPKSPTISTSTST